MIASQADNCISVFVQVCRGRFNLKDCFINAEGIACHIPGIGNLKGFEWFGLVDRMEVVTQVSGCLSNGLGSKACPWPITGSGIKGNAKDGYITPRYIP